MANHSTSVQIPKLIVGNLDYIQNNLALEPYEIWLKLKPDADRMTITQYFVDKRFQVVKWIDTREELLRAKNDPYQMAINGVMTLGYLLSRVRIHQAVKLGED